MRCTLIRPLIFALAACGATTAFADSRLFSARADKADVTVDQALINGQPLAVAGKGGGVTFFRIDSLNAEVPCANQIVFVTSDGQKRDFDGDFCELNWQVTLAVAEEAEPAAVEPAPEEAATAVEPEPAAPPAAPAKAPEPVATAPAPSAPKIPAPSRIVTAAKNETITIKTDGSATNVRAVLLDGEPVAITEQKGDTLKIEVASADGGIKCDRNLGFNLADGQTLMRSVNICANGGSIAVALTADSAPQAEEPAAVAEEDVTASAPVAPKPLPTPPSTRAPAPPTAVATATPALPEPLVPDGVPVPLTAWSFTGEAGIASLTFGIPESDATEFSASCKETSSRIRVSLAPLVADLAPDTRISVTFRAGAFSKTFPATGSPADASGLSRPEFNVGARDPLWQAIIGEAALAVLVGENAPFTLSLKGSAVPARRFVTACLPKPPSPPPVATAGPGGGLRVSYSCRDGSSLIVTFDLRRARAILAEPGAPPVVLLRTPSQRGDRFAAGPSALIGLDEEIRWTRFGEPARVCAPNVG